MSVSGKTEHGFFHQIKEKLFSGEKHVDSEWEAAYAQYTRLSDSLHKLKSNAVSYSSALHAALFTSNAAATEFAQLLEDPVTESGYETLSKQHLLAHQSLGAERQNALAQRIGEQVLQPLDKIIQGNLDLNGRVAKRNEMHTNFEYYLAKMTNLNKERDERGSKGKAESSSQREKHERNQAKLDAARMEYQSFSLPLIADLHAAWNNRAAAVGPILAAFASIEKEFVQIYGSQIEQVRPEMVGVGGIASSSATAVPRSALGTPAPMPAVSPMPTNTAAPSTMAAATEINNAAAAAPAAAAGTYGLAQPAIITTTSVTAITPNVDTTITGNTDTTAAGYNAGLANAGSSGSDVFGEVNQQTPPQQYGGMQQQPYGTQQPQQYGTQQVLAEQQQQQTPTGNPFETPSRPVDVAAGSSVEGANQGGVSLSQSVEAASALPPLEQRTDPVGGAQPQPDLAAEQQQQPKSAFEDESKRQRFEEDNKTANIIGV